MATQTIYVPDEDVPVLQQAKEMFAGELSSMVVAFLRQTVAVRSVAMKDMKTQEITIGEWLFDGGENTSIKRFIGKHLACGHNNIAGDFRRMEWNIYLTRKNKILVYYRYRTHWQGASDYADYTVLDRIPADRIVTVQWEHLEQPPSYQVYNRSTHQYDRVVLCPLRVPGGIVQDALDAIGEDVAEDLDV